MGVYKIEIDSDERGFTLTLWDDDTGEHTFNVHHVAEDLYDQAKRRIGPWLAERDAAYATRSAHVTPQEAQELLDYGVYDDDPAKRLWAERVAKGER